MKRSGKRLKVSPASLDIFPIEMMDYILSYLKYSPSSLWSFSQTKRYHYNIVMNNPSFKNYRITREFYKILEKIEYSEDHILRSNKNELLKIISNSDFDPNIPLLTTRGDKEFLQNHSRNTPLLSICYLFYNCGLDEEATLIIIESLLDKKADPNRVVIGKNSDEDGGFLTFSGCPPLYFADNSAEIVKILLEYNADPELKNYDGKTFLEALIAMPAPDRDNIKDIIIYSIQHGAEINDYIKRKFNQLMSGEDIDELSPQEWLEKQYEIYSPSKKLKLNTLAS